MSFEFNVASYSLSTFEALFKLAFNERASDIALIPNDPPWIKVNGQWEAGTGVYLSNSEIEHLIGEMSKSQSASSKILSGEDQDFSYELTVGRGEKIRFRVNATGCRVEQSTGIAVVMRTIMPTPPMLSDLNIEQAIVDSITPLYGLVLFTGPVGSGKTTLIAATLREILTNSSRHVITYEDPIEFDLKNIPGRRGLVAQTEIQKGLRDFSRAPRNSLRRAGDVILFGESRDHDTLRNLSIVSETGVAVYTTVHTNSVAETISRMVREFPYEERDGLAAALVTSMRLIVHQRLFRNDSGQRVALREYLVFDEDVRQELMRKKHEELTQAIDSLVEERGQSLSLAAKKAFQEGRLSAKGYDEIIAIKMSEKRGIY